MKALVLWADRESANLGVRVLAEGSASLIKSAWGDDVEVDFQDFGGTETGFPMGKKEILSDALQFGRPFRRFLRSYDVIWDTGAGDSFTDIYGWKRFAQMFYVQRSAISAGLPLILGPQTIGPFGRVGEVAARNVLRGAAAAFPRDEVSAQYQQSITSAQPTKSTDVVFALPTPHAEKSRDIVLNVSGLLTNDNTHVDAEYYRKLVRELITQLTEQGRQVTLLAHVLSNPWGDDDVPAVEELGRETGLEVVIPTDLASARATLATANIVLGSRMHACLNALSMGVPTLPLAYSRKFAPLFGDIGWNHVLDLRDRIGVDDIIAALAEAESDRASVEAVLARAREKLQELSRVLKAMPVS